MRFFSACLAGIFLVVTNTPGRPQTAQAPTVVFVCEHGSAKSVIAAAHFNRISEAKGLPYRAISRGVHPDTTIPDNIKSGLSGDGLDVASWKPKPIADEDIREAERVVTLGCELPKSKSVTTEKVANWTGIPPVSDGYAQARADIVQKLEDLLKALEATRPPQQ
jgi:protein-tyrosine-phosphatase